MKATDIENALVSINGILSQIDPIVATVGAVAAIVIKIAKHDGVEVGTLEQELARMGAAREGIRDAIDKWNSEHPMNPATGPTSAGDPRGD